MNVYWTIRISHLKLCIFPAAAQPYYALSTSQAGADLGGAITGALAASAYAHQQSNPAYYTTLMTAARQVYTWSSAYAANGPLYVPTSFPSWC